ncbi:aldo/keto reductase [Terrilactibacillus laevilacticus]|uniref:Aldo/keto reductase family oxidoreductase n=1 Tax=Terrilactibacillus laevilacticus TaxID=1380157 RepID=A0ABW5PRT6_9BACI|nr:aldo/keto reductase [Terrilactibacillus laevilacticus]
MRIMPIEKRKLTTSRLVLGCMGFGGNWDHSPVTQDDIYIAEQAVDTALSIGMTMFDLADIYRMGKSETVFGKILNSKPNLREKIIIQSKCGIRFDDNVGPFRYDFSKKHIIESVNGILKRLGTDYLDILLLHRPDPLMEPEEVAEAFDELKTSGKVRYFGVSNMNASQIQHIQTYASEPIIVNQLELNLKKLDWLEQSVLVNETKGSQTQFGPGLIEYCMMQNIQVQAWSPLARGLYSGNVPKDISEADRKTIELIEKMALEKGTTKESIVLGWLMRHPMKIQPVIGTTNTTRIKNCQDAVRQSELMTREEWYSLYETSRGSKLP